MPDPRRHGRRYLIRFGIAVAVYTVLLPLGLFASQHSSGVAAMAATQIPLPALLLGVWALWRYLREVDEMLRDELLRCIAGGFGLGTVLCFSYGMAQFAGAPQLSWTWVPAVYLGSWGVLALLAGLRNR